MKALILLTMVGAVAARARPPPQCKPGQTLAFGSCVPNEILPTDFLFDEVKEGGAASGSIGQGQSHGTESIDQDIQGEAAEQGLGGLGDNDESIANMEEGPAGEVSPVEEVKEEISPETVLGRIAERKLQYLVPENEEAILAVTTQPHILAALRNQYDADKDGVISAQEWSDFRPTIAAYIKDVLGFEPVSPEEWDTVIQGDEALDIEGHMFPALFSMTTEPLFDDLAAALYWAFDADKDGMLSPAEAAEFKTNGPWLDPEAIPAARPFHYQPLLAEIAADQGNEAACAIVARFEDVLKAPLADHGLQC